VIAGYAGFESARPLLQRMVTELLGKRHIAASGIDDVVLDYLGCFQMPVHPEVAEARALAWAAPDVTYSFHKQEDLFWEQNLRRYIRVCG